MAISNADDYQPSYANPKNSKIIGIMFVVAALTSAGLTIQAQTFETAYTFGGYYDGAHPWGTLVVAEGNLFGTTLRGGINGTGTIFVFNAGSTSFCNVHSFSAAYGFPPYFNTDGMAPFAGLTLQNDRLFGVASLGGTNMNGTLFSIKTDGSSFTNLHTFKGGQESYPLGTLTASATLYTGQNISGTAFFRSKPTPTISRIFIPSAA